VSAYPATLLCDFYKLSHRPQYPDGTETVYATWTPRTSRVANVKHVVAFGFQAFIKKYLIAYFNEHFFSRSKADVVAEYVRFVKHTLGDPNPYTKHLEELHDLGHLPILIRAVPEGTLVPIRVPMLTIENTDKRFFWLTNYLETLISCESWLASTSATTAYEYKKILMAYAQETGDPGFVPFQGHDFSMRGMACLEAAETSGSGHLLSFAGTDTCPAISHLEKYYNANIEKELVGTSIPATEHSVMCAGGSDSEYETYRRLITETYPSGFISIVSDTWDLWHTLNVIIRSLKDSIVARDGKVVIRPDSGDPVLIICGDPNAEDPLVRKGVIEILWDIFGGTINEKGYKCLDPHIGCIYGDAITLDRCDAICHGLKLKGFASTNMVFGIGSFTYNYVTRDTFGFAMKSTHVTINGKDMPIFKNPVTDNGVKKSQKGRVAVLRDEDGELYLQDGLDSHTTLLGDQLHPVFMDGKLLRQWSLADIRLRLETQDDIQPEFEFVAIDAETHRG
jgi:nicotinamide phosphoribosyltransferase